MPHTRFPPTVSRAVQVPKSANVMILDPESNTILPVVDPPMVKVFSSVVERDLYPPASVRFPDTEADPVVVRPENVGVSVVRRF